MRAKVRTWLLSKETELSDPIIGIIENIKKSRFRQSPLRLSGRRMELPEMGCAVIRDFA
jgi:hypothetical protein